MLGVTCEDVAWEMVATAASTHAALPSLALDLRLADMFGRTALHWAALTYAPRLPIIFVCLSVVY